MVLAKGVPYNINPGLLRSLNDPKAHRPGGLNQRVANLKPAYQHLVMQAQRRQHAESLRNRESDTNYKTPKRTKPKPEFKHLKMHRSLETVSKTYKAKTREQIGEGGEQFTDYPLAPKIQEALVQDILVDLKDINPTPIQRLAIPAILDIDVKAPPSNKNMQSFLVAAETGSGKTLAYLLPIIHNMKLEEDFDAKQQAQELDAAQRDKALFNVESYEIYTGIPRPQPRVVILLPTSELVHQVGGIVKKLSHTVKYRVALLSREFSPTVIRSRLEGNPDVVISTPSIFNSIAQQEPEILSRCHYIVADEADSLFDRSFSKITQSILMRAEPLKQIVLCSATIPKSLDALIRATYPKITRLVTPQIHSIPRRVVLGIVDIDGEPYMGQKNLACADVLYNIAKDPEEEGYIKKVIVFVNSRETTGPLTEYLRTKHIDTVELGRDTSSRTEQQDVLGFFIGPKVPAPPLEKGGGSLSPTHRALKRMKVLVTTDIASRGVDTKMVKNVVLYDVPFSTVDFIHRIGRAGRMGKRGRVTVLVDKTTNKAWVREIKECMHMGQSLL